jgi:hypothetical protein
MNVAEHRVGFVEVLGACSFVRSVLFAINLEVALLYITFFLCSGEMFDLSCVFQFRPCNSYFRDRPEVNVRAVKLAEVRIN